VVKQYLKKNWGSNFVIVKCFVNPLKRYHVNFLKNNEIKCYVNYVTNMRNL